jgi:RNA polymerase sigma factor (sigma-70 family)
MPDDVTRDLSKCMHYAAWRVNGATTRRTATRWRRAHIEARNGIVVGNRKLIFKAVKKWASCGLPADDLVGECHLVLIKAVASYNPWLGIRFSTYAVTCLIRALSRLAQRHAADRLSRSLPLESLPHVEPAYHDCAEAADPRLDCLGQLLQEDAQLLTAREKLVISWRYLLNDRNHKTETLKQVGRGLGLSKERVRQVQNSALLKLREALTSAAPAAAKPVPIAAGN